MNKVKWDEDQIETLAAVFVRLRSKYIFERFNKILDMAQAECLLPEQRRKFTSINNAPLLKSRIVALWEKQSSAEPIPPQIIEIPVEKPVDFIELANRLDDATLGAMVLKRLIDGFKTGHPTSNGVHTSATARSAAPIISLFTPPAEEKKRFIRVAFGHVDEGMFSRLKIEIEKQGLPVDLRGVDIAVRKPQIPVSADFVVFMRNAAGGGIHWKNVLHQWGKRCFIVENSMESAMQKFRDLVSLNIHVPALPVREAARV